MKQIKCDNCGANIDGSICPYCNTKYNLDKKETQENSSQQEVLNEINTSERPKINVGIAILLIILYWPIGIIYLANKVQKQKKWDKENNKKD